MSGCLVFQLSTWLLASPHTSWRLSFDAVLLVCVYLFLFKLIPLLLAPGQRKGWKEKKKSHPGSCHGAASGACLDAAARRRLFQCVQLGQGMVCSTEALTFHTEASISAAGLAARGDIQASFPKPLKCSDPAMPQVPRQAPPWAMLMVFPGVASGVCFALNPEMGLSYLEYPI